MKNRLFAIGDIHGCFEQLREMLEGKIRVEKEDKIILLGDYIDRGPEIRRTIDYIIQLKSEGYNLITLRGNHEMMMLHAISTGDLSAWFWNGGESTVASFGASKPWKLDTSYMQFFEGLTWYHGEGSYLFVHAGFDNFDPFNNRNAMIWTRNEVYTNPLLSDKIIIHGHSPINVQQCIEGVNSDNHVINIDTGCVYDDPGYRTLTAIELTPGEKTLWHVGR